MNNKHVKPGDFIPYIIEKGIGTKSYALMIVELDECPICKKQILNVPKKSYIFPTWYEIDIDNQLKKAGWVLASQETQEGKIICIECSKSGKSTFLCALCGLRKPTSKIEESIGWPAEYLCKDCYETKTAKEWDDMVKKLNAEHRYDYE